MNAKLFCQYNVSRLILCFLCSTLLTSCWYQAFSHEEHITDDYYLIAVDVDEDMGIGYNDDGGAAWDVAIQSTVFAVGYNENFIIAKQHPHQFFEPIDKTITNYFIIPLKDKVSEFPYDNKIGPLTLKQFNEKRKELNVPQELTFTIEIEKLK